MSYRRFQWEDEECHGGRRKFLWGLVLLLSAWLAYDSVTGARAAELRELSAREEALDRRLSELFEAHSRSLESPDEPPPLPSELWRVHAAAQAVRARIEALHAAWPWAGVGCAPVTDENSLPPLPALPSAAAGRCEAGDR